MPAKPRKNKDTQTKSAPSELNQLRERCDLLTRTMFVVELSADGTIEHANEQFNSITGYAPAELVGRSEQLLLGTQATQDSVYATL